MGRNLEEIIIEFEQQRQNFNDTKRSKGLTKETLLEFETRFSNLKADIRPHIAKISAEHEKRSDKQATAIKYRIAIAIHEGRLQDEDGKQIYNECSINQAEKFASGSEKYKEFLEQKTFYKESYVNVRDLREDIGTFINLIKDFMKIY